MTLSASVERKKEACHKCYEALVKNATENAMNNPIPAGAVYDDSAWLFLKKNVPKYSN